MRNIAPVRALTRRSNQIKTLALVVAAIGVFVTAVGLFLRVVEFVVPANPNYGLYDLLRTVTLIAGIFLLLLALGLAIRAFTWKVDNDLAQIMGNALATQLPDSFTLIRNLSRGEIGYVDALLVGLPGVLVFRLMDNVGIFANEGSNWLRQEGGEWRPAGIDPTRECVADIEKVRQFLSRRNLGDTPVYGVIVFMNEPPRTQLMAREPVVPITPLSMLVVNLRPNYLAKDRIDAAKAQAVIDALLPK